MSYVARPALFADTPAMQVHLLGTVDYELCLSLQQRLVYETSGRADGQITLLICEHEGLISVGRSGSRAHIHLSQHGLESHRLAVHWTNRGGGCVLHALGQLAIYPIVPLDWHGWTAGEYQRRLQQAIVTTLIELRVPACTRAGRHGVWGRCGQLAMLGTAVKGWTAYHGAYLNVSPAMHLMRLVQSDPWDGSPPSCLLAERQQPVRMTRVRESLVRHVAAALDCDRFHVYSGHPLWAQCREQLRPREPVERVG
jgi:lipoyl(octanoyl) transferase